MKGWATPTCRISCSGELPLRSVLAALKALVYYIIRFNPPPPPHTGSGPQEKAQAGPKSHARGLSSFTWLILLFGVGSEKAAFK